MPMHGAAKGLLLRARAHPHMGGAAPDQEALREAGAVAARTPAAWVVPLLGRVLDELHVLRCAPPEGAPGGGRHELRAPPAKRQSEVSTSFHACGHVCATLLFTL
jgi:hypothetical protein